MRSFLLCEPCLIALKSSWIHFPFSPPPPRSQLTQSRCHHYKYNLVDKKAKTRESTASWTSIVSVWAPRWAKVVPFYVKIMSWEHSNILMAQNIKSAFMYIKPPKSQNRILDSFPVGASRMGSSPNIFTLPPSIYAGSITARKLVSLIWFLLKDNIRPLGMGPHRP